MTQGACGNVVMMGAGLRPSGKLMELPPDPKITRASHFYPNHRLFCHITQNWRGKPLRTFETIVELIGNTRTVAGLRVQAKLDSRKYRTGVAITKAQMSDLALRPHAFHGEWNYELQPRELTR
jgi:hypothetical protein